ncbi:MAG TPA: glycosyltransferase family 9 protein, partial [Isosphaeraceae bacterium]|nr:glycosyltransferase family 9 protein [Isosphaeraceae bacterium]
RRITLLTSPAGAESAALIPSVDEVIIYAAPWMKATSPRADSRADHALIRRLHDARFDAAAIFTVYSQNPLPAATLCTLAEVPLRLAHCRENPYQLLTHWVPDPEPEHLLRHEVRRQLDLVRSVGCQISDERMVLEVPSVARMRVLGQLQRLGVDPRSAWVVIHPGATAPSRRYPPEQFALAARRLVLDVDMQVIFTGSSAERTEVEQIQTAMGVHSFSLAGELDLGELAALLAMAPLLIANNTGPVHIAAAVGTPVVDLYALTNPQHTPWGVPNRVLNHDVPCKYCYKSVCPEGHHHCLALVPPEAVVEAVRSLLTETGRLRGGPCPHPQIQVGDASESGLTV